MSDATVEQAISPIDWGETLAQNARWIRTVIFARVGSPDAVDEVFQEVALAAVRQDAPLRDPNKVGPWLYRLAVIQSALYRRKLGRRRRLNAEYAETAAPIVAESVDQESADPIRWLLRRERRRLVRTALEQLPRREAELLLLKYAEGWNYRRMAEHLGVTVPAIQSRLHRARARMRSLLTAEGVCEEDIE
jgi:RNA polymerase sigma factor (sigma-70 family)